MLRRLIIDFRLRTRRWHPRDAPYLIRASLPNLEDSFVSIPSTHARGYPPSVIRYCTALEPIKEHAQPTPFRIHRSSCLFHQR
jgi:hypothetical protein